MQQRSVSIRFETQFVGSSTRNSLQKLTYATQCNGHTVFFSKRRKNNSLCAHCVAAWLLHTYACGFIQWAWCHNSSFSMWDTCDLFSRLICPAWCFSQGGFVSKVDSKRHPNFSNQLVLPFDLLNGKQGSSMKTVEFLEDHGWWGNKLERFEGTNSLLFLK